MSICYSPIDVQHYWSLPKDSSLSKILWHHFVLIFFLAIPFFFFPVLLTSPRNYLILWYYHGTSGNSSADESLNLFNSIHWSANPALYRMVTLPSCKSTMLISDSEHWLILRILQKLPATLTIFSNLIRPSKRSTILHLLWSIPREAQSSFFFEWLFLVYHELPLTINSL